MGGGHISDVLKKNGYTVHSTDLINRGYEGTVCEDFLKTAHINAMDIITNPPYKFAREFVEHALDISIQGIKIAMFLKLQFLEGKARRKLFDENPPRVIYVSSGRLLCAKNAEFEKMKAGGGSAVAYAWFIWEKGYRGDTVVKWIN